MKILITGGNGMVAKAAAEHCRESGDEVIALSRAELDISDGVSVRSAIADHHPAAVINCAAYTNVDGAESEPEKAYATNVNGVENLAYACREFGSRFVTISTDYVFDGEIDGFYSQRETPNPQGVYARTKREGEVAAQVINAGTIIVRSGWIYGGGGTNFLSVMHRMLAEGNPVKAIGDSFGTPTFAGDLAKRLREIAELNLPVIFHVTNAGPGTSYLGFAEKVCEIGGYDASLIEPISKDELQRPSPRPANSKLTCLLSRRFGLKPMADWEDALSRFLSAYGR